MAMEFVDGAWVLVCATCGTKHPQSWVTTGEAEACSGCSKVRDTSPRDSFGQIVRVPTDRIGTYSDAIGEVVKSSHHYADILKKNGLSLADGRESYSEKKR